MSTKLRATHKNNVLSLALILDTPFRAPSDRPQWGLHGDSLAREGKLLSRGCPVIPMERSDTHGAGIEQNEQGASGGG
jgi:hypothetical protein